MRVLVTGADGFVASHLCEYLIRRGCYVIGLVRRTSGCRLKNIGHLSGKMEIVWGDVTDATQMRGVTYGVDVIFHLAAMSHVAYSIGNPEEAYLQNVIGGFNILEASRDNDVKRIVHAGSAEVYGTMADELLTEKDPLLPRSAYAASKASVDRLMYAYWCSYRTPVVMARFFGIYGPRQSPEKAIPKFIGQVFSGSPITIYGDGRQTRDYMYVADCVEAYGKLGLDAGSEVIGEVVNVARGDRIEIGEVAKAIREAMAQFGVYVVGISYEGNLREAEAPHLACDPKKIHTLIDWDPTVEFRTGISRTIGYYKAHPELFEGLGRRL